MTLCYFLNNVKKSSHNDFLGPKYSARDSDYGHRYRHMQTCNSIPLVITACWIANKVMVSIKSTLVSIKWVIVKPLAVWCKMLQCIGYSPVVATLGSLYFHSLDRADTSMQHKEGCCMAKIFSRPTMFVVFTDCPRTVFKTPNCESVGLEISRHTVLLPCVHLCDIILCCNNNSAEPGFFWESLVVGDENV